MSELITVAVRVADRLAVVGPRMAARLADRDAPEAAALLADVRAVLQQLADLGADAEHRARQPVPELAAHALGDQVLVLAHDVATHADEPSRQAALDALRVLTRRI